MPDNYYDIAISYLEALRGSETICAYTVEKQDDRQLFLIARVYEQVYDAVCERRVIVYEGRDGTTHRPFNPLV